MKQSASVRISILELRQCPSAPAIEPFSRQLVLSSPRVDNCGAYSTVRKLYQPLFMDALGKRKKLIFIVVLVVLFFFRLAVGLSSEFRSDVGDERQIYLIGLKCYTTGTWPYFGPDVSSTIQIPGALQGLVVGLPFFVLPIPEAPFIFLNILSFLGLCFFAWYCTKRLPEIPRWFVWLWLLTVPWTLNLSTQVVNPSYVLAGSILFFVGAIETYPFLTKKVIPIKLANFMMGLSLFWIMQFHLSWVILLPYVLLSFYFQYKLDRRAFRAAAGWFIGGALITSSFLIPTFFKFGLAGGLGGTKEAVQINPDNLLRHLNIVEGVLGRFLSFASYELPRFIGGNTGARWTFVQENPWLAPFIVFLTVVGVLQPIAMLVLWFSKKHPHSDWKAIRLFTLATVILLYISFLFSIKAPLSHTFYVTFPVAILYSLYCWDKYLVRPFWRRFAAIVIACGIIFQLGLAIHNYSRISIYLDRKKISEAIKSNDYRLLDERRPGARY